MEIGMWIYWAILTCFSLAFGFWIIMIAIGIVATIIEETKKALDRRRARQRELDILLEIQRRGMR